MNHFHSVDAWCPLQLSFTSSKEHIFEKKKKVICIAMCNLRKTDTSSKPQNEFITALELSGEQWNRIALQSDYLIACVSCLAGLPFLAVCKNDEQSTFQQSSSL